MAELLGRVGRRPAVEVCLDAVRRGPGEVRLAGLTDPAKTIVAAFAAASLVRPVILLVESNRRAEELLEPIRYFFQAFARKPASRVAFLPSQEVSPWEGRSPHAEISEARASALWRIALGEADIVLAPVEAAIMRLRERSVYEGLASQLEREQEIPQHEFLEHLTSVGYERRETVESPGQFAIRGGIVDVFSPESNAPVRLEFFGDTLESLREFDPNSQRSMRPLERATLLPLTDYPRRNELLERFRERTVTGREDEGMPAAFYPGWEFHPALLEETKSNLLDLAPDAIILEDEPETLRSALELKRESWAAEFEEAVGPAATAEADRYFLTAEEWKSALSGRPRLLLDHLALEGESEKKVLTLQSQPTSRYHGNVPMFMSEVRNHIESGRQVMVSVASTGEAERLADICHENELPFRLGDVDESATSSRLAQDSSGGTVTALVLLKAPLSEGVVFPEAKLVLYGNADLFDSIPAPARSRARPQSAVFSSDFSDLKPGDYVVHVDHGIGQFEGLRQLAVDSANGEFMLLRYAEDARLYVPLARVDLIQKYQSLGGAVPALDRLGTTVWETRKSRVKKSVGEMAEKLLALYAERKAAPGHAYPVDTQWQKAFEDAFEFQETPDQAKAIEDVKRDLESGEPMERLLCGDVGYGKTEVAMRAAFKVVSDSRQVAVLAPTTVLAFQHYDTFRRRFAAFPIGIEMLSRFRTAVQQKKTLQELEAGRVDIVIGTHRLLSRDVKFQDLGLLVVDEEQRFGVAHKERIKEMRKNVDVLSMSATPIPRTLHMSLIGLRDMSVIETPPRDRLAIQTVVAPFSESIVKRAIEHELDRGGQVFFVHNRVESIASVASLVKRLVPKARVIVGHGQMNEAALEKVMLQFVRGDADVLVSTTIIENGLDIPRANTIVINRADRLGLSELYQLRGRVGRSNQHAYAYLLVPPEGSLSSLARQRLAALKEFSDLGAGFRIAALDLELRGAGNLLGREQHGQIVSVGFDLYCRLLERAVAERKGESVTPDRRATLNLGQDIRIPVEYIESENLRLRIYKRIAGVSNDKERDEVRRELADRFGVLPPAVENLLDYAVLKALAESLTVASIERRGDLVAIKFHEETPVKPEKLVRVIRGKRGMRLDPTGVLWFEWKREGEGVAVAARNILLQLQS
ncbi:MAG: transcription-repair coupling factor [Candidatus Acidiferrales bacterium]